MSKIILLLGAPGVGKGTHAMRIAKKTGFVHVSTGDLLREAVKDGKALGKQVRGYMEKGELVPNQLVVEIILDKIKSADGCDGFILDGFPRNISQAVTLMEILKDRNEKLDLALDIEVEEQELIDRLTSRRVCKVCGRVYNVKYKPPKKAGICDVCGGELYQRSDDTAETVKNRLKVYEKETSPLIDYFDKMGILKTVQGIGGIEAVSSEIMKIMDNLRSKK